VFVALVASLLVGSTGRLHFASKPDVAVADRWLVLFRADAPPAVTDTLLTEVARRGRVNRRWSSALRGVLITVAPRDARWLSEQPGVEGVFQDVVIDAPWSTPLPDCSAGVAQSPLPSVNPQAITCADPDPQNLAAVCTDNWGSTGSMGHR